MKLALFLLLCIGFISYIIRRQIFIHTSTMAAIMAFGIVIYGVFTHLFDSTFASILVTIVLALWVSFWFSIILSVIQGKWKSLHYSNPINRFGIGTWIGASSICGILIVQYFPSLRSLVVGFSLINALLWIFYCVLSIQAFITIGRNRTGKEVHGILLLTTVSTQSMILSFHTVFPTIPNYLTISLLFIGLSFYLVSSFFILKRYLSESWSIETDWNNTNCILHGALSITGIAGIISGVLNEHILFILWIMTAIIFIIVELIEIYRLRRLVKRFGWRETIGKYNVTQWSRIFTFSMFYTFTTSLPATTGWFTITQLIIKQTGITIILALLIYEIALALRHLFKNKEVKQELQKPA